MPGISLIAGIIALGAILSGCTAGNLPPEKSPVQQSQPAAKPAMESRGTEWERTVSEARKEGLVSIYIFSGITPSVRQEMRQVMKSKYGVELEMTAARATELAEKIIREQKAGLYLADLYMGGATTAIIRIKPAGVLEPIEPLLTLPEVKEPGLWWEGKLPFVDKEKLILAYAAYPSGGVAYNADYVSKEDLQSYQNLLNPRWKGKIVMSDPTIGGSGSMWFGTIGLRVLGMDYLKELAKQDMAFTRDLRLMSEWMARGKYPVGIGMSTGPIVEMRQAGVPLHEYVPKEGAYLTSGGHNLALLKKAPHPNATRLFVNWLLSKEGQTLYSRLSDIQSARIDIPSDFLSGAGVRQPGMSYVDVRGEEAQLQREGDMQVAREVFNIR